MGVAAPGLQRQGPILVGDGRQGIAEGELHVAAVAPGRRIPRRQLQHLIPEGQGLAEVALTAGLQRLIEQLG
jgi:hypothetical protein